MNEKLALKNEAAAPTLRHFLGGKSAHTISLFDHFMEEHKKVGGIAAQQRA